MLHDDGRVGIRYVDAQNIIQFAETQIVDDSGDGVWVTGIPDSAAMLETGQDFLKEGTEVSSTSSGL